MIALVEAEESTRALKDEVIGVSLVGTGLTAGVVKLVTGVETGVVTTGTLLDDELVVLAGVLVVTAGAIVVLLDETAVATEADEEMPTFRKSRRLTLTPLPARSTRDSRGSKHT